MVNRKNHRRFAIKPVKRDIAAVTKGDEPFAKLGIHLLNRPTDFGLIAQDIHTFADGFRRAAGSGWVLVGKEIVQPLDIS